MPFRDLSRVTGKPRMFCRCHDTGRLKEQSPCRSRAQGGLRELGRGALGQRHPLIGSQTHSANWCIPDVHLNEMRVEGGAWLAEPWVQSPVGILILSHQIRWCLACNPSTPEVEAGGLDVQGHHCLYNKFKAILEYARPCLNKQREETCSWVT